MSAQEQVNFLLACIRHSHEGKIDFDAVATDLKIASKAAAAKRYERLKKRAHAEAEGEASTPKTTPRKSRAKNASNTPATPGTPSTPTSAKRKRGGFTAINNEEEEPQDDDEAVVETPTKVAKIVKMSTPRKRTKKVTEEPIKEVKEEAKIDEDEDENEAKQDSDEDVAVVKKEFQNTSINAAEI